MVECNRNFCRFLNQIFLVLFWDCFRGCVDINDSLEAKEFCDEKEIKEWKKDDDPTIFGGLSFFYVNFLSNQKYASTLLKGMNLDKTQKVAFSHFQGKISCQILAWIFQFITFLVTGNYTLTK